MATATSTPTMLRQDEGVFRRFGRTRALRQLKKRNRYEPFRIELFGATFHGTDGPSFYHSFQEIFVDRIYEFHAESDRPRIIDGGSNIGLSVLFFKQQYPTSQIVAFEPNPRIFAALEHNVSAMQLDDVKLVKKALWTDDTQLSFHADGADAGHITHSSASDSVVTVEACSLKPYLVDKVDFLKLDIEGAETDVLADCVNELSCVRNLFVEYHSFVDRPQELSKLTTVLTDAGFRLQMHTQFASPQPFLSRPQQYGMDLQLNIFATRT